MTNFYHEEVDAPAKCIRFFEKRKDHIIMWRPIYEKYSVQSPRLSQKSSRTRWHSPLLSKDCGMVGTLREMVLMVDTGSITTVS